MDRENTNSQRSDNEMCFISNIKQLSNNHQSESSMHSILLENKYAQEKFKQYFSMHSVTSKYLGLNKEDLQIRYIDFQDLLQLFLNEHNLDQEFKELIFSILDITFVTDICIEYKIIKFIEFQYLIMSLSSLIKIAEKYQKVSLYKKLHEFIQEKVAYIEDKANHFASKKNDDRVEEDKEYQILDDKKNAEIEIVNKEKIRITLEIVVNKICEYFLPEETLLNNCGEGAYLNFIAVISKMLYNFKSDEKLDLEALEVIQFINEALIMTIATDLSIYDIINIAIKDMKLKIYDEEVRLKLFDYIELGKNREINEVLKFKMHCYKLLILKNCDILPEVLQDIKETNIWKYSKCFFQIYISSLDICQKIIDYETEYQNNPELELLLYKNAYY